jgi:ABC-2 type transport system permease protein
MAVTDLVRSVRESFRVGWKIESNWADPLLFATYRIVQPLASLLIVAFIVIIGASLPGSGLPKMYLASLIVSTAFFVYAGQIITNMGWLVFTDRSRYEVLKNIYLSPGTLQAYIIGRGLVSVLNATVSVIVTLLFSIAVFNFGLNLQIPINLLGVNVLLLMPAVLLGIAGLIAVGYMLTAISIVSNRLEFIMGESIAGIFFLLGGVIFPATALPDIIRPISTVLPVTYYLDVVRDSFGLGNGSNVLMDFAYLALTTLGIIALAALVFNRAEVRAKKLGLFDRKSEY